jgi:hypothetical protein
MEPNIRPFRTAADIIEKFIDSIAPLSPLALIDDQQGATTRYRGPALFTLRHPDL